MTNISIMGISHNSVVDGDGIRDVIFTAGCPHHCYGCHNFDTWDMRNGTQMSTCDIIKELNLHCNLTLSGGEPFLQAKQLVELIKEYKNIKKDANIWIYSGFLFDDLIKNPLHLELLKECDILVDGMFMMHKKKRGLRFKGSTNQRIIDIKKSLEEGKIVRKDEEDGRKN